jgi:alginate O-acetyltransferase complex protein AlgI
MLFNSYIFLIFLAISVPAYIFIRGASNKKIFLIAASYLFYTYWDWRFSFLLAGLTVFDHELAKMIFAGEKKRKAFFLFGIAVNITVLLFFKYYNFFIDGLGTAAGMFDFKLDALHIKIIVPLGVSFFVFQSISYIADVYNKKTPPCDSLIDFSLFIVFFPKISAGPIERANDLLPQFKTLNKPTSAQISEGIELIILGLFKKTLIGDTAGRYVTHIFGDMSIYNSAEVISALLLFSVQVYADFSGYTNIARGASKLFGIELTENFNQPYFSKNIGEFWRRWHISLSFWLRDYVYLPLSFSFSRRLPADKYFGIKSEYLIYSAATAVTFTLCGFWHGASLNFILWGFIHGLYLIFHRVFFADRRSFINKRLLKKIDKRLKIALSLIFTNMLIIISFILFILPDFQSVNIFLQKLISWENSDLPVLFFTITISYAAILVITDFMEIKAGSHAFLSLLKNRSVRYGVMSAIMFTVLIYMYQAKTSPFIYLQF